MDFGNTVTKGIFGLEEGGGDGENYEEYSGNVFLSLPMPPHFLMNFRGLPPGCGDGVADF